jgi:hypothetical protein
VLKETAGKRKKFGEAIARADKYGDTSTTVSAGSSYEKCFMTLRTPPSGS